MSSIGWMLVILAAGYLILLLLMYVMQPKMIYYPAQQLAADPADIGLSFKEVTFETEDDHQLHGWFVSADEKALTVLYCHGNAGNISGRLETLRLLHSLGLNIFIFDYRGYGKSEGTPTEQGTYTDARAAWHYLTEEQKIDPGTIIVMGRSLGGSIAAWLAAQKNPAAAIIESTFTSAADLGADLYPWVPVRWLLRYDYRTEDYIQNIEAPLFMAHSRDDEIVPFRHGKTLFEKAPEPKTFVELRGSHGAGFLETEPQYRRQLRSFLEKFTSYRTH